MRAGTDPANRSTPWVRWGQRVGPWLGIGTGPGALAVGGALADRFSPPALVGVILVGGFLLTALATAQGWRSWRRRQPLAAQAEAVFGKFGKALNLAMALGLLGWLGFYIGLGGAMTAHLLGLPDPLGALLLTALLAGVAGRGVDRWNALAGWTAVAAVLTALLVFWRVGVTWPAPPWRAPRALDLGVGLTQVVAYAIIFALRAGDFTWDLERAEDVWKVGGVLYGTLVIFMGMGALMGWTLGRWNPAEALTRTPGATLGELLLSLAVIAPALSALHSASLALSALLPRPPGFLSLWIALFGGILGAGRFDQRLLPFLDGLGLAMPPALIVMLANEGLGLDLPSSLRAGAWLAGAVGALGLRFVAFPFPMMGGLLIALAVLGLGILGSKVWRACAQAGAKEPVSHPSTDSHPR
ncbi:hypothetical protein [Thermoflexus hugenholtzii]